MTSEPGQASEASRSVGASTPQPNKPTVTWDLRPSKDPEAASTSCVPGGLDSRRRRRERLRGITSAGGPRVIFVTPKTAQTPVLFSLMNCSEAAVKKVLPKSHLSQVIIRDNFHAQRTYNMQEKALEKARKKALQWHEHLKKKFMADQLRKMGHWRQESMKIQPYLDSLKVQEFQLRLNSSKKKAVTEVTEESSVPGPQ